MDIIEEKRGATTTVGEASTEPERHDTVGFKVSLIDAVRPLSAF